jgi:hypothetical protein
MCHHVKTNRVIILLETNNYAKMIKAQHPEKARAMHQTIE